MRYSGLDHRLCLLIAAGGAALLAAPSLVQAQNSTGTVVVQPVPGGVRLDAALARLGRDPQDVSALAEAGKASLDLGDYQAAIGFFKRAETLAPGNDAILAGLAGAYVLAEDPFSAIPLFDAAQKLGPIEPARLSDRALAHDLVGDNVTAQSYYAKALAAGPNDETTRRLALSQAIGGDRRGMEVTLSPLLQRQDKAAWRTRAFALAILGVPDEAESVARATMPAQLATSISAYLRYMPRLTPAQQAAAANLGHFPRASEIGHDDPRLAQFARPATIIASAQQTLAPSGVPLGTKADRKGRQETTARPRTTEPRTTEQKPPVRTASVAPPEPKPTREVEGEPVRLASVAVQPQVKPASVSAPIPPQSLPPVETAAVVAAPASATPGFSTLESAASTSAPAKVEPATPLPAPVVSVPAEPAPKPRDLNEVFADLSPPSKEAAPASGAVDLRQIKPARPAVAAVTDKSAKDAGAKGKSGKDAKPAPPSHPSRIWVQVATGRDKRALASDWKRMLKDQPKLLQGKKGHTSAWGQTNRLLTGPFESEAAAKAFLAQLKKGGMAGAFLWSSPAGQVVDALPAGK